jgi:hypothetical protein
MSKKSKPSKTPVCCLCSKDADGPMFIMMGNMAHADCVIKKLNRLLDPDWQVGTLPREIVGYLKDDQKE